MSKEGSVCLKVRPGGIEVFGEGTMTITPQEGYSISRMTTVHATIVLNLVKDDRAEGKKKADK